MIAWAGLAERSAAGRALWGARGRGPRAVAGLLAPALALAAGCRAPVAHDDEALSVGFSGCAAVTVVLAAGASSPVCKLEAGGAVRLVSERASIARVAPSGQEVALAAGPDSKVGHRINLGWVGGLLASVTAVGVALPQASLALLPVGALLLVLHAQHRIKSAWGRIPS